jgi:hypothetical protein
MFKIKAIILTLVLCLYGSPSFSCQFTTDCSPGSSCVKPSGSLYGWCVGGLYPGNSNDRKPARDPLDLTGKRGNTCSFDIDCGVGGKCVKGASIYGTCL